MSQYPYQYIRRGTLLPVFTALSFFYQLAAQSESSYWAKNVAILDMRTRSVSATAYVREIVIRDFNGSAPLMPNFGFGPDLFADNGAGNDQIAGDGVYSSERCYAHNTAMPFIALNKVLSIVEAVILDTQFQYTEQIEHWLAIAALSDKRGIIKCNLKLCACPAPCICFACEWGAATWCLDWRNCETSPALQW